jgi:Ni,Fe-hydrogenase I large subunit
VRSRELSVNPEGELVVRAAWDGSRVTGVEIESTRPRIADQLLAGRTVAEAVAMLPRLYSICGRAQGVAAALACEAATGTAAPSRVLDERDAQVRHECTQEILRRILLDWPRLAGMTPDVAALDDVRRVLAAEPEAAGDVLRAIVAERVLGAGGDWATLDLAASGEQWLEGAKTPVAALLGRFAAPCARLAASGVALLPADGEAVARAVGVALAADAEYERAPSWQGAPAETGSLARMRLHPWIDAIVTRTGASTLARMAARVVELVAAVRPGVAQVAHVAGAVPVSPGVGLGWVETVRGLLVHAAEVAAGRVRRYRIVAPTEWNFHPRGALAAGLAGVSAAGEDELRALVRLAVESLDPCVAHRVELVRA